MLNRRGCGVLLHPTSLPGNEGIGTLGDHARRFVDLLETMGMKYWQVLPLTPPACGNSPYSSFSAFAGNPLLIDLHLIAGEGDLPGGYSGDEASQIDFDAVAMWKNPLLMDAGARFLAHGDITRKQEFWDFCNRTPWLHNYALFTALKRRYKGRPWNKWPSGVALLTKDQYEKSSIALESEIGIHKYIQWQFFRQWKSLKEYAGIRGISIIGDIPIFVAYDSADVWSNRDLFLLDPLGKPTAVAGVPPDYFSETGQLWGNPLYNWETLGRQGYQWWVDRFKASYELYDVVRVDHFRGFEAAWHVPSGAKTAVSGSWVKAPGAQLFDTVMSHLGPLPIIAEDLGVITPEVTALRDRYNFPGMKIVQFAFDSDSSNPYLPHNHERNSAVYTGTHDNDTTAGWFASLQQSQQRKVMQYVGCADGDATGAVIRAVCMSVANTAIVPFQDLLRLGSDARMNVPGSAFGNWGWRFAWDMITRSLAGDVRKQLECYGRCAPLT